jgi:hypothetical protein
MKRISCLLMISAALGFSSLLVSSSLAGADDKSYVWPIEKTRKLSSTFAEHRDFHFHSGIDIPTQKKTGYKVFACQSGYVYRLFASWKGYGKAIYLKLDDGRFAVYGHLSGFSRNLSEVVTREQLQTKRYKTDIFLDENQIRVDRGGVIGYSGESGWGGPHLHFELRDSLQNPTNPLSSGFFVNDRRPPTMDYLTIRPLDVEARVDGSSKPLILPLNWNDGEEQYRLAQTPLIEGEVGLELSVYDKMNGSNFRLGVYSIELYLDDSLLFRARYDEVSFENTHLVELDRDFELKEKGKGFFHKLFVEEGNELPIYQPGGGKIDADAGEPGSHTVTITAGDASGNVSLVSFPLIFDKRPSILSCSFEKEGGKDRIRVAFEDPDDEVKEISVEKSSLDTISWREVGLIKLSESRGERLFPFSEEFVDPVLLRVSVKDSFGAYSEYRYLTVNPEKLTETDDFDSLDFELRYDFSAYSFIFELEFNQILKDPPRIWLESGGFEIDPLTFEQTDERNFGLAFPFFLTEEREVSLYVQGTTLSDDIYTNSRTIPIAIISKTYGGAATSSDGMAWVEFDTGVVYQSINVAIHEEEMGFGSDHNHSLVSKIYSFQPSTVPFSSRAKVSIKYPPENSDPEKLGLYELSKDGTWSYVGQKLDTLRGVVGGDVRHLSVFAILEDTLPPEISKISVSPRKKIKTKRPQIKARVEDDLSGIGSDEDIIVEIDGEWMIPEYDVEKHILSTQPVSPLSPGRHLLTVRAKDRVGNEARVEREFFVRRR